MFLARPEGYKGKQLENGFTEYFVAGNYYGVISFEDGVVQENGKKLLESFKEGLLSAEITQLSSFESTVSNLILKLNFPAHVGMAIGMFHKDALYIKTIGDGQIYFRRGKAFDVLLSGDNTASGYLNQYDLVLFTTTKIQSLIGQKADIQAFIGMSKPADILEKLHNEEYGEEDQGFIALMIEFEPAEDASHTESEVKTLQTAVSQTGSSEVKQPLVFHDPMSQQTQSPPLPVSPPDTTSQNNSLMHKILAFIKTKQFTVIIAVVLLGVLTWSVAFGYQRREAEKLQGKVDSVRTQVDAKLTSAIEESFLNVEQSLVLISEAEALVSELKNEVGENKASEITAMEQKIQDTENKISKKESKPFTEFYDLTLENKQAQGSAVSKENELVAILDKSQKAVYVLNLGSKALKKYANDAVSSASAIGIYNEDVYFFTSDKGIFKFTSQTKVNNIVPKDEDWKRVVDMQVYSGNIYILDEEANEIDKYLVTEGGYSDKKSYFGSGQTIRLSNATGMAIDSAIYVSTKSQLLKFLSGVKESFSPSFPFEGASYDDIYTDSDLEQVYVLDQKHGAVYAISKNGEYQLQIQSNIFAKATALFVFDKTIYVLSKEKIYGVSLE